MIEQFIASLGQTFFAVAATVICFLVFVLVAWRTLIGTSKEESRNLANLPFSDDAPNMKEGNDER